MRRTTRVVLLSSLMVNTRIYCIPNPKHMLQYVSIISSTCFGVFSEVVNLNEVIKYDEGNVSTQSSFLPLPPGTALLQGFPVEDLLPPYQWTTTVLSSSDLIIQICGHSPAYCGSSIKAIIPTVLEAVCGDDLFFFPMTTFFSNGELSIGLGKLMKIRLRCI